MCVFSGRNTNTVIHGSETFFIKMFKIFLHKKEKKKRKESINNNVLWDFVWSKESKYYLVNFDSLRKTLVNQTIHIKWK